MTVYNVFSVASRVAAKSPFTLMKETLYAQLWEPCRTVRVKEIKNISQQILQLMFESPRQTGGGPIEKIYVDHAQHCAYITFSEAAGNRKRETSYSLLIKKSFKNNLRMNICGCNKTVAGHYPSANEQVKNFCTIIHFFSN